MKFKDNPLQMEVVKADSGGADNGTATSNDDKKATITTIEPTKQPTKPTPDPKEEPQKEKEESKPKEGEKRTPIYWGSAGVLFSLTLLFLALAYKSAKS